MCHHSPFVQQDDSDRDSPIHVVVVTVAFGGRLVLVVAVTAYTSCQSRSGEKDIGGRTRGRGDS